jgi:hypothetical protein
MKTLVLAACRAVEKLLREEQDDPGAYCVQMMEYNLQYCRKWER